MLYLIGLGLDGKDLSLKAAEALGQCDAVYCEFYTGMWNGDIKSIEKLIGRNIKQLMREEVESDFLVREAKTRNVALLVPGDPLAATTHFQLLLDAKEAGIECRVVHSASIFTAIAETGLHLYKFGRTTTLVRDFSASSPYDIIRENRKAGLHSLVLLDIGMTADEGIKALIKNKSIEEDEKILVCSNLGTHKAGIEYGSSGSIKTKEVPAVVIIPGNLNFKEEEALELWK